MVCDPIKGGGMGAGRVTGTGERGTLFLLLAWARAACRINPAKDCHVATAAMQERHGMNQMGQIETRWSTEVQHVRLPNLGRL